MPHEEFGRRIEGVREQLDELVRRTSDRPALSAASELIARSRELVEALVEAERAFRGEVDQHARAEQEIRESETKLRSVLASTLDPIITIDTHGIIQAASDSVERIFGWTPDELVGRNIDVLMPEPHRTRHDAYLARYRETGVTTILGRTREFDGIRRDGSTFPVEVSVSRVIVPSSDEPLFTGIIHDITERKRAERELALLQSLALAVGEAKDLTTAMSVTLERICDVTGWAYGEAWVPDAAGQELEDTPVRHAAGRGLDRYHALTHGTHFRKGEGLPGRVWASKRPEWIDDVTRDPVLGRADEARRSGLTAAVAVPIVSEDEVVAVIAFFMTGRREEDKRLTDLVAAAVAPLGPVIRRKRTEAALIESERRLREMLQNVELLAVSLDRAGRVTFCNDHLLHLTGWSRAEVIGQSWLERFVPADRAAAVGRILREAVEDGRVRAHDEGEILTRSGVRRFVAWNHTVLRDPAGHVIGTTGLGVDVTDQRRDAEELERHRQHLEELVAERTAELEATHGQLRTADRLASIGTLAAGLGHDMNNVLLPVRARLDALDSTDVPPAVREHFEAVRRSVAYLQQLADGLHMLALDPEDRQATTDVTDLRSWWEQVGPLLARSLPRHVALTTDWPDDLPLVAVTPHRLTQAVLNLLVNAGEAVGQDGRVRVWASAVDGGLVRLGVTDNGEGMTPEVRERALDPFFTTRKRGLGTGLGLALVRGVATSAGGSVSIESEPGRGTTVSVTLAGVEPRVPRRAGGEAGAAPRAVVSLADRRMAGFVATFLEPAGFEVQYSVNGDPGDCDVWVTAPSAQALAAARRIASERDRQVVVVGPAPEEWQALNAIFIEDPDDFESLRAKMGDVVASAMEGAP